MNFQEWWKQARVHEIVKVKNPAALERLAKAAFEAGVAEGLVAAREQAALEREADLDVHLTLKGAGLL